MAVGVRDPLKSSVTGPSLLVNCYLETKFHEQIRVKLGCDNVKEESDSIIEECDSVKEESDSVKEECDSVKKRIVTV